MAIDISVVICTWNRARQLDDTLRSLASLRTGCDLRWELVIVDNNSTDDTSRVVEQAAAAYPVPLRYIFEPHQGKSSAMNTGIAAARGTVIAFTDDDVRVPETWLTAVADHLLGGGPHDYAGGPVRPIWERVPPRWFARTGRTLWGTLAILDYGEEIFVFEDRTRIPLGANFAIRRRLIDRIGGFDPTLGRTGDRLLLGQELPEFFARSRAAGATGIYLPQMAIEHHVPARRVTPAYCRRWWYGKGVSRARMEMRHPVTELGLDLRRVPKVWGVPRFLFGSAARDLTRWIVATLTFDAGSRLAAETQLCYFAGQLRERVRHRRKGGPTARLRSVAPRVTLD